MPADEDWAVAVERAGALFGADVDARVISPRSVARFARVAAHAEQLRAPAADLVAVLGELLPQVGVDLDDHPARVHTAEVGERLLGALRRADGPAALVSALARAEVDVPLVTLGKSMSTASEVAQALRSADWQMLHQLQRLDVPGAEQIRDTLRIGAVTNEDAANLAKLLREARDRTLDLIVVPAPAPRPTPPRPPTPDTVTLTGTRDEVLGRLRETLPERGRIEVTYRRLDDGDR
ncbi:MAG: hypothetical protein H0V92_08095 [Pseudonocardiales bacterium]|nr:hypothetical protein [Pseudonocardiales bacterium]